jgi:hypothetical protein
VKFIPLHVLVVGLLGTFFVLGCASKIGKNANELDNSSTKEVQNRFIGYEIDNFSSGLESGVDIVEKAISSNRDFVLLYFLDGAFTASEVAEITSKYNRFLNFDGLILRDRSGKVISRTGILSPIMDMFDTVMITKSSDNLLMGVTKELSLNSAGLTITAVKIIGKQLLTSLAKVTGETVLLFENDRCMLTNNGVDIKTVSVNLDKKIVLNGTSKEFVKTDISDSVSIISVIN